MTKIFATKALSMVLCFVMLFMGAPVTTWAEDEQSITVKKGDEVVPNDNIILNTAGDTLTLTANGFTNGDGGDNNQNVEWSLSNNAETWVSLSYTTGAETTLKLDTLPAFDTTVQVKAKGVTNSDEEKTVPVKLVAPTDWSVIEPDGKDVGLTGVCSLALTAPSDEYSFSAFAAQTDITADVSWDSSNKDVATVDEGLVDILTAGSTVISATYGGKTVAFPLRVESGIDHISLYNGEAELTKGAATAKVGDKITAKVYTSEDESDEVAGADVVWSVMLDGIAAIETADYSVDGSSLMFLTDGTYTVSATSSFDTSMSSDEVTFTVAAAAATVADDIKVKDPGGSELAASEVEGVDYALTLTYGDVDEYELTAEAYFGEDPLETQPTFAWTSDNTDVVMVDDTGKLSIVAAGAATITVKVGAVAKTIAVTVEEAEPGAATFTFTPRAAVYNTDLWSIDDTSSYARFLKFIGFIEDGESINDFIKHVKVTDSSGKVVAQTDAFDGFHGIGDFLCLDSWLENNIDDLRKDGYVSDDKLPIVFDYHYMLARFKMEDLTPGTYTVELITFDGVTHKSSITIAHNEVYENAEWTKGSSENLLIAKMPNITNDLLATKISDLKISKDGTQLLKDKGITDILVVDAETGNVYVKKAILDTLEAGTYSIGFTVVGNEELLNFTVVAANSAPDSEVRTLSTDVTISVGGVARKQNIMVRDIHNILSDDTQLYVDVASEAHDELDTPIFDVEHGFHYNIKLLDAAGNELPMPLSAEVELLFECVEGLDIGQLEIVLADSLTDTQFEEDYQTYGDAQYVGVLTNHFSPYSLFDIQTEDEKAALGKGKNNKTGDQAVQIAVAGLGSILVLALGIMLKLITSKKKFEE